MWKKLQTTKQKLFSVSPGLKFKLCQDYSSVDSVQQSSKKHLISSRQDYIFNTRTWLSNSPSTLRELSTSQKSEKKQMKHRNHDAKQPVWHHWEFKLGHEGKQTGIILCLIINNHLIRAVGSSLLSRSAPLFSQYNLCKISPACQHLHYHSKNILHGTWANIVS